MNNLIKFKLHAVVLAGSLYYFFSLSVDPKISILMLVLMVGIYFGISRYLEARWSDSLRADGLYSWEVASFALCHIGVYLSFFLPRSIAMGTYVNYFNDFISIGISLMLLGICGFIFVAFKRTKFRTSGGGFESKRQVYYAKRFLVVFVFLCSASLVVGSLQYWSMKADLSYFKTSAVSEATKNIVKGHDGAIEIAAFFPYDNEVYEKVEDYFQELKSVDNKLKFHLYDKFLNPDKSEDYKIKGNGIVVIRTNGVEERINLGLSFARSRTKLTAFDKYIYKALSIVTKGKRIIYLARGHGELHEDNGLEGLQSVRKFAVLLRNEGYTVRTLGSASILNGDKLDEKSIIVFLTPKTEISELESKRVLSHVQSGGGVMIFSDIRSKEDVERSAHPMNQIFSKLSIDFKESPIALDAGYVKATHTKADKWFVISNNFTTHPSVHTMLSDKKNTPLVIFRAGHMQLPKNAEQNISKVAPTVKSSSSSYVDHNRNFLRDLKEDSGERTLGAAVEYGKGRGMIFATSSIISDSLIPVKANAQFIRSGLSWLEGHGAVGGLEEEGDIKVSHKEGMSGFVLLFSLFGGPLLVLLIKIFRGYWVKQNK